MEYPRVSPPPPGTAHPVHRYANASSVYGAECAAANRGDASWRCLFAQFRLPYLITPYLLLASQYDSFGLYANSATRDVHTPPITAAQLEYSRTFANETAQQVRSLHHAASTAGRMMGGFSWACFGHQTALAQDTFDVLRCGSGNGTMGEALSRLIDGEAVNWIDECVGLDCSPMCGAFPPPPPAPPAPPSVPRAPLQVFVHMMPWFETPASDGQWGWHWTMNNSDPNQLHADGRRQIASHFYPAIGPYASGDRHVIEWQLLLMKAAGINGVLIDWYGVSNVDSRKIANNTDVLIEALVDLDLQFAIVLEDRFSLHLESMKEDLRYVADHYFPLPNYARDARTGRPMLCVFGPIRYTQPSDWVEILFGVHPDSCMCS